MYNIPEKQHIESILPALRNKQVHITEVATPHFIPQRDTRRFRVFFYFLRFLADHVDHAVDCIAGQIVVEESDGV